LNKIGGRGQRPAQRFARTLSCLHKTTTYRGSEMMKLKPLILVMAVLSLVWGAGFLLLPAQMWGLYGITLDSGGIYIARMLGVVFFMLGLILWLAKNDPGSQSLRAIVIGLGVGNLIGFVVTLWGQLTVDISMLGWVGVSSFLLLGLGFGYHLLQDHPTSDLSVSN